MGSRAEKKRAKKEVLELEQLVKDTKRRYIKTSCIQNLKLFKGILNFTMPFVLSATITTGVVFGFSGKLPFVQDEIKKTKRIDFSCVQNTVIESTSHYENRWWSVAYPIPRSKIVIETPWTYEDGLYKKDTITYDAESITDEKIIESIITGNIDYFLTTYSSHCNQETTRTPVVQELGGDYIVDADIHMLDEEKIISQLESMGANIGVTVLDIIFGFACGAFWAYKRDFSIKVTINNVRFEINEAKEEYVTAKKRLALKKGAK